MTVRTDQANGVTSPDNWTLGAGASKTAAVNAPDDDATSYVDSGTSSGTVQTFTVSPGLPSGATVSQVKVNFRYKRGGGSNVNFVVGYSFTKQGGGTQTGESGTQVGTSSWQSGAYTHSGLSANWGSGFTIYARNTQARSVQISTLEVEFTYTALEILPSGLAVAASFGSPTVWSHKIVKAVATGNDDAWEDSAGTVSLNSTTFNVTSAYRAAFIIRDLLIPAEAGITTSHIEVVPSTDDPILTIKGQRNPADLTTTSHDISGRTLTSTGVTWSAANIGTGSYKSSPEIKTVLQEMVDTGWTPGDDMLFALTDNGSGGQLVADSYNFTPANAPRVVIEWTFGAPDQSVTPSGLAVSAGKGTPTVGRGTVNVAPSGKAVGVAVGTAAIQRGTVNIAPAGKAVSVGKGTAAIGLKIAPSGKAVAATFGATRLANVVAPSGKAVTVAIGTAVVGRGAVAIAPSGKAVTVAIGGMVVGQGGALILPSGLAVTVAAGTAAIQRGAVNIAVSGLAMTATIGAAWVSLDIAASGLAVGIADGTAVVSGGVVAIAPAGLAVGVAHGNATVWMYRLVIDLVEDATEDSAGTMYLSSTSINVNSGSPYAAFRASNLPVPAAATIQEAYLELWPITYDDPKLEQYVELSAAAAALTSTAYNISDRTPSAAAAVWSAANVGTSGHVASPNFGPALKEIVDLPEYEAGVSDVLVVLRDLGLGGWLRAYSADAGASFRPRLVILWAAGSALLSVGPLGLAVAAGFGEAALTTGGVGIAASGLAVGFAAGSAAIQGGAIVLAPEGLAVAVTIGDPVLAGGLEDIAPEGLAVAADVGAPTLSHGLYGSGLVVAVAIGAAAIGRGTVGITVSGLAVAVAIGTAAVSRVGVDIAPAGKAVAVAAGSAVIGRGTVGIAVSGLAVGIGLGSAAVRMVIAPAGLAAGAGLGGVAVGMVVSPAGMAVSVGVGSAAAGRGTVAIAPAGLAVEATAGTAAIQRAGVGIAPSGLSVGVAAGSAEIYISTQFIRPSGVSAAAILGALMIIAATTPAGRIYIVPRRV